jgi:hypothetical protein
MSEPRTKTVRAHLTDLVGIAPDADDATALAALDEAIAEAEETNRTPRPAAGQTARPVAASAAPVAYQPPTGTLVVDEGMFASLKDRATGFETMRAELARRVGCDDSADAPTVMAALDEALSEVAESLPDGVEMVAATELAELRADAQLHRTSAERSVVENAVRDGRIPPRDRGHWVNLLAVSPSAAETLESLPKGLIPLEPKGYTGSLEAVGEGIDDPLDKLFGEG